MTVELRRRLFTVEDYYGMARAGILDEDDRVELIEGEILEMAAIGSRHAACVNRLNQLLSGTAGDGVIVSVQNPVRLSDLSEPQPDLAVLRPREDFYEGAHPGPDDVLLIVEVALTTLEFDREVKAPLYARAGVPELWIVNLEDRALEVYREPSEGRYRTVQRMGPQDSVSPESLPSVTVRLEKVLG